MGAHKVVTIIVLAVAKAAVLVSAGIPVMEVAAVLAKLVVKPIAVMRVQVRVLMETIDQYGESTFHLSEW